MCRNISKERNVAGAAEGNQQLSDFSLDATTDRPAIAQCIDSITNDFSGLRRNARIVLRENTPAKLRGIALASDERASLT